MLSVRERERNKERVRERAYSCMQCIGLGTGLVPQRMVSELPELFHVVVVDIEFGQAVGFLCKEKRSLVCACTS